MKKLYAIADVRDDGTMGMWVTDPIILENDIQASMAFTNYQEQLIKAHVRIAELRLYQIGEFENDDKEAPLTAIEPKEIPVMIISGEEEDE